MDQSKHGSVTNPDTPRDTSSNKPDSETVPDKFGGRFQPGMFILSVGPDKYLYEVHKAVLCQSPVLSAFCNSKFKEASEKHIELPGDDPAVIGVLIQYLYAQDFDIKATETNPADLADELADMYIVADKYQLDLLKALTVAKFRASKVVSSSALSLFPAAQRVYEDVPESDTVFKGYFREVAPSCVVDLPFEKQSDFLENHNFDGKFGKDVIAAFFAALVQKDTFNKSDKQASLQRTRLRHMEAHTRCNYCFGGT